MRMKNYECGYRYQVIFQDQNCDALTSTGTLECYPRYEIFLNGSFPALVSM